MDILEEIVAHKRIEIEQRKQFIAPRQLYGMVAQKLDEKQATTTTFVTALMNQKQVSLPSLNASLQVRGG